MPSGIFKHKSPSIETRKKMSLSKIGNNYGSGNKGGHRSEETKRKIGLKSIGNKSKTGMKCTKETILKMSLASKGKPKSKEHIKNMIISHKGQIPWNKNKKTPMNVRKKISESRIGEKNWNYRGGITPILNRIRKSFKYKQWRQDVFIRDNFICKRCTENGRGIYAHHIKYFGSFIKEIQINLPLLDLYEGAMIYTPLWDINNGITVCLKCHKELHKHKR